ncbi:MAG: hypothetical protein R3F41_18695 [Gammaproteobacteria bacterium]|nr:hypothetical protein [Pseudomonadales bacterium]MCP5347581.1 hypothetical protein [Pseudomonadales bacterium]
MTHKSYNWRSLDIRSTAVGVSLLLSALMVLMGWLPNEDAFTYIRTVEIFRDEGLAAAYSHYPWATYPVLIALVQGLTPLDPFLSAVAVNALFYALLVYSFISLVAEIDASRTTLVLAAITVLVYPQLNENRLIIIRDGAFWALSLFGLWQYLRFVRSRQRANAAAFALAFLLAAGFRAEALVYLFLIPVSLLADSRIDLAGRCRLTGLFMASSAGILLLLVGLGFAAGLNLPALFVEQLSVYLPFARETFFPADQRTAELGRAIFGDYAANFTSDYLPVFMFAGLVAILLAFFLKGIGGPMLLALLAGLVRRIKPVPRWQLAPLIMVIAINTLIAMAFLITTRFLSSRYVMLMCLVCVVYVPLVLARLRQSAVEAGRGRSNSWLVGLLLSYCAVDAYYSFGEDKHYLQDAGEWIAANSNPGITLLTNNRTVAYYSERSEDYDLIPILLTEADILHVPPGSLIAFEEDTSTMGLFDSAGMRRAVEEVIRIGPESGRQVVIYRRQPDRES